VSAVTLNLARCHFPVHGLGFGRRVGVWVQGCSIHCPGCIVPETWIAGPEHRTALDDLLGALLPWLDGCDGVTISGGEPFDQPEALAALLAALRTLCTGDLLVYSGYPWGLLQSRWRQVLSLCDAVISEPFRAGQRGEEPIAGSSNQYLHSLTPLAEERYRDWRSFERRFDIAEDGGAVRLVGIPRPGQLQTLCQDLRAAGFPAETTHEPV
jgi:anaerobic ribonucleoside-triphosphate reductase activating protein